MDTFISIAEAITTYSKSESTIRAIVRKIGNKKGIVKREKLINGSYKIYISRTYLDKVLKDKNSHSETDNSTNTQNTENDKLISFLQQQLEVKDKTIESLLERQRENNILMSQLQQKVLLIEESAPKKKIRWWQRKR